VRTPAGEIPWSILSRLSDEEMKKLMSDVVNRTYLLLQTLLDEAVVPYLIQTLKRQDLVSCRTKARTGTTSTFPSCPLKSRTVSFPQ